MKKLGILLFVLLASFLCIISCQYNINNTDNARVLEESYYSILFETNGGNLEETKKVVLYSDLVIALQIYLIYLKNDNDPHLA